jgi:hypothetical protein
MITVIILQNKVHKPNYQYDFLDRFVIQNLLLPNF